MSVTTLPHMIPYEVDGAREDWWEFCCQLCDYTTWGGSFNNAEQQAAEHLEEHHLRRYRRALEEEAASRPESPTPTEPTHDPSCQQGPPKGDVHAHQHEPTDLARHRSVG